MLKFFRSARSDHEKMVDKAAKKLAARGHENIRANLKRYEKPRRVISKLSGEAFMPDLTSTKDGRFMIYSVVNRESLAQGGMDATWTLFEKFARQNDAAFYIVFPLNLVGEVKGKIEALKIAPQLWEFS